MLIFDRLILNDAPRLTVDGYLVASAKVARVGIQEYSGAETGRPLLDKVRVYRPEATVFDKLAMGSFAWKPVTNDHPNEQVTSANWRKYAVGQIGDEVARDGDAIRIPLVLMDAETIAQVQAGKVELSMGYTVDLEWESGTTADGLSFDAIQKNIRANHLAVVDRARGGPTLRLGDDDMTNVPTLKTIHFDGLPVEITEAGATLVDKLVREKGELTGKLTASEKMFADDAAKHAGALAAKDGEIAAIKKEVLTDEQVEAQALALVQLWDDAKALAPKLEIKGMKGPAIRKAAVTASLGEEACKDQPQGFFDGAFPGLVIMARKNPPADTLRDAIRSGGTGGAHGNGSSGSMSESGKAWEAARLADQEAWKGRKTA